MGEKKNFIIYNYFQKFSSKKNYNLEATTN